MSKGVVYILVIIVGVLIGSIGFILLKKQDLLYRLQLKLDTMKNIFLYIVEWILYLCVIYFFLNFLTVYHYQNIFSLCYLFLLVFSISIFTVYFLILFFKNKDCIQNIFVLIMIPIGLSFLFLMLPDFIPDEPAHFQKAYLTSNFNFTSSIQVFIDSDYVVQEIKNYSEILPSIYFDFGSSNYTEFNNACGYNFILYLLPALGINLGKLLHLSLYGCYYLGRMVNLCVYIFFGYYSIKLAPKMKWIIFAFMFNPMFIHLAASYSSDCMINSVCIFSVAYFTKLYYSEENITNRDIVIVISLIFLIAVVKYAFLPLFGIYFLIIPKLLNIERSQWIFLICCIVLGISFLGLHVFVLAKNGETIESQVSYLIENNVDPGKQIELLLSNPVNILAMIKNTFIENKDFYFSSFVGQLGWLNIGINIISHRLFYFLLFFSACLEKNTFSILNRIWFLLLSMVLGIIIILGLYLYWTPVGYPISLGVQGRYFAPTILLILTAVSNGILSKIKYKNEIVFLLAVLVNIFVFKDVFLFFL